MKNHLSMCYRLFPIVLLVFFLSACEVAGGVEPPTTPGTLPTRAVPTATPTSIPSPEPASTLDDDTSAAPDVTPTIEARGIALRLGFEDEPADVLPYHANASDARITAPVSELLFPSPILALGYAYTATSVLERMPSFANGDIELRPTRVYLDERGAITPEETDVITDAQQLVITYRWSPDLRWSDGVTVTADDSLFAYELSQQVSLGEDADKRLKLVEQYETVDQHTTRAFLQPELPDVIAAISPTHEADFTLSENILAFWAPLPRHILADVPSDDLLSGEFAFQPVSYGPYVVERREAGSIRLQRNPYYSIDELPEAAAISFVFASDVEELYEGLLSGSLDVVVLDHNDLAYLDTLEQEEESGGLDVHYVPGPIWEHLDFNLDFTLLQDARARKAIAYGFNRQALVEEIFNGRVPVLDSWILPEHWAAAEPEQLVQYTYDPDQARGLLEEVNLIDTDDDGVREQGIDHDSDGTLETSVPITLTLLTTENTPLRAQIAERFQADMADIGLAVTIETTSTRHLFDPQGILFQRQFELAQFAWIANTDPRGFELWSCTAVPSEANNWSGSNLPGWCSREANQAIITATTALARSTRHDAYSQHQKLFTEDIPALPLFQRMTVVLNKPGLRGLRPDPTAPITWNIATWSRE